MFFRIEPNHLVKGSKYKIVEDNGSTYTATFVKIVYIPNELYLMFSKGQKTWFLLNCDVYNFVPQNPQWKMERRAVNLIVRRLIGDDNFEW